MQGSAANWMWNVSRRVCGTLSKALLKSRRTQSICFPLPQPPWLCQFIDSYLVMCRRRFDVVMMSLLCRVPVGLSLTWDTFDERFSHRYSKSMEILARSNPICSQVIALEFDTWHDSCVIMPFARFGSDIISNNWVTLKPSLHRIWIMVKKSFASGPLFCRWVRPKHVSSRCRGSGLASVTLGTV